MRFRGLDLNLLMVFDLLMETRSVVRTSERLSRSQPATSAALARLREFFDDPLFVLHGKRMYPTALAESLLPRVRACLGAADALVGTSAHFDPATSDRVFRIVASDSAAASVLAPLSRRLESIGPSVRLESLTPEAETLAMLARGDVDLLITPSVFTVGELPLEHFYDEQHVLVGCAKNPIFNASITEQQMFSLGHVAVVMQAGKTPVFGDRQMRMLGKSPRVEATVSSFAAVPWLLVNTKRVSVMHSRLARVMSKHFAIKYAPLPFELPTMQMYMQFHHAHAENAGLRWLMHQLRAVVHEP